MREIINGIRYNTDTANKVCDYWNGIGDADFRYINETLYKTVKNNYFVAGEGGPMSKYAEPCGNSGLSGGSHITPLSKRQAMEWCERTKNYETIETEFKDRIEDA